MELLAASGVPVIINVKVRGALRVAVAACEVTARAGLPLIHGGQLGQLPHGGRCSGAYRAVDRRVL